MLLDLGVDLGADRNRAHDDLLFTLLFRQPRWLAATAPGGVDRRLDLYERLRTGGPTGVGDLASLLGAVPGFYPRLGRWAGVARAAWSHRRAGPTGSWGWGWKEPNTHVVLEHLVARWPQLRYVHVVRHGLDMAWSRNTQQLERWGSTFGIEPPRDEHDVPRAQLDWWIMSTDRAVRLGEALGERYLLLNYDALCAEPKAGVVRLAALLGVEVTGDQVAGLAAVVDPPSSVGRWRERGTDRFRPEQLESVAALGFEV